jgi:Protein of unknown function (DUF3987)
LAKLTAVGDGLARGVGALARFLIAWPSSTIGTRAYKPGDLNGSELSAFDARLKQLLAYPLPLDEDGALNPPVLRLTPEAFEIWRQLHDDIEQELGSKGEFAELPDFGAKAAEQAARLACVLHVFEHGPKGEIDAALMRAGACLAIWYLAETRRVFTLIGHSGETSDAELLLDWLKDHVEAQRPRDIQRLGPPALRDKSRRDTAITKLVDHGLARREYRDGIEYIILNPKVRP